MISQGHSQSFAQGKNQDLFLSIMGVILLIITAQIVIPIHPVPITLQSAAVIFLGLTYTPRQAFYATTAYLLCGAAGLRIFAGGVGGVYMLVGHRAGYFFGFILAATCVAWLKSNWQISTRLPEWLKDQLLALSGTTIIYLCGVPWLAVYIGFEQALQFGLLPFILPGLVKNGLMTCALHYIRKRV